MTFDSGSWKFSAEEKLWRTSNPKVSTVGSMEMQAYKTLPPRKVP